MQLTKEWLDKNDACPESLVCFAEHYEPAGISDSVEILKDLMTDERKAYVKDKFEANSLDWANWLIGRVMTRPQYLAYAIYAAEQVLDNFEKEYPDDKRPRAAIEAAKAVLKNDTEVNRSAAWAAARAADDACAAWAVSAADDASAAASAARAASAAAWSACAACAACAADSAAWASGTGMLKTILEYGVGILEKERKK